MPLGQTRVGPRSHVLDGGPDPSQKEALYADRLGQWRHFSQTLGGLTFHTQLLLRVRYCNA